MISFSIFLFVTSTLLSALSQARFEDVEAEYLAPTSRHSTLKSAWDFHEEASATFKGQRELLSTLKVNVPKRTIGSRIGSVVSTDQGKWNHRVGFPSPPKPVFVPANYQITSGKGKWHGADIEGGWGELCFPPTMPPRKVIPRSG